MNTEKNRANLLGFEWIVEGDEVCFRPMIFDEEAIRTVRYYPDPCEFQSLASARAALAKLEAETRGSNL
jgi:hypothetical protein